MSTYEKMQIEFKNEFFGSVAIGVLVQSILGGIAAMAVLTHGTNIFQMIQLMLVVAACMVFNGSVLSNQKPKIIMNLFLAATAVNVVLAAINFIR